MSAVIDVGNLLAPPPSNKVVHIGIECECGKTFKFACRYGSVLASDVKSLKMRVWQHAQEKEGHAQLSMPQAQALLVRCWDCEWSDEYPVPAAAIADEAGGIGIRQLSLPPQPLTSSPFYPSPPRSGRESAPGTGTVQLQPRLRESAAPRQASRTRSRSLKRRLRRIEDKLDAIIERLR